jgi:Na+-driven multidrug efflux pump
MTAPTVRHSSHDDDRTGHDHRAVSSARAVSYGRIVRVSAPMVASTAATIGTQLVVIGLIGRIGDAALYVRSLYTPVAFLFLAVTTGLAVTLQVAVAQCRGRGDETQISGYLGGVARLGGLLYLLMVGALIGSAGVLEAALRTAPDRRGTFSEFLIAMAGAALFGMLGELCAAVLRGLGRTGTAALVTATYVGCYLGVVVVGGLVLRGGLMAVALGNALAGLCELGVGLIILVHGGVIDMRAFAGWRRDVPRLAVSIGLPVGSSYVVLCVVNLLLLRIVAPAGQAAVAGFGVGYMLQTAVIVPAIGLGSAVAVLMNQSVAAGSVQAARTVFKRGIFLAAGGYVAVTVVVVIAGGQVASLMSGNPAVAAQAREFVSVVGPAFGCMGLGLTALTILEQVGYGALAAAMNAGYFATIVTIGWLLVAHTGRVSDLYTTMTLAASCGLIIALPVYFAVAKRPRVLRREQPRERPRDIARPREETA